MTQQSPRLINPWSGRLAALLVCILIGSTLLSVAFQAGPTTQIGAADLAALRFTLLQATLSALISLFLAIPVARALARRRFVGRQILILLLGMPFILPVIVAILGLLKVFGRVGWFNQAAGFLGLPELHIYGLHGVVLAHVFFNLPLATRLILQAWQEVPAEHYRLAAQLRIEGRAMFRLIEWPVLKKSVPGAFAVIFAICLSSFAVALTLGGGPRATTLELAIYQAFRFDFDLGRAALLSCAQLILTLLAGFAVLRLSHTSPQTAKTERPLLRYDGQHLSARISDLLWIMLVTCFLLLPICAIILSGFQGIFTLPYSVFQAAITSVILAAGSTCIMLVLALPISWLCVSSPNSGNLAELSGLLGLAASPLVIGTGLFILIRPLADPFALALPVTALVNAIMALPFALRVLIPRARDLTKRYGKLGMSLNMAGSPFVRQVFLPGMRPQIGFAAGLCAALSMGDLGVITLFADADLATLPLQIYRLMGAYKMQAASAAGVLLMILSFSLFWLCDRGGKWHAEI